jgi:hypothetical protein
MASVTAIEHGKSQATAMVTGVSIASTGDKASFAPSVPVNVLRWGIIATTTFTGAPVITMDFRPTISSDTSRVTGATSGGVDTAGGTLTPGTLAAGKQSYRNVKQAAASGLSSTGTPAATGIQVLPGQELVAKVGTAAGAGAGVFFWEYEELPAQGAAWTTNATLKTA